MDQAEHSGRGYKVACQERPAVDVRDVIALMRINYDRVAARDGGG
jgi:hypothetical protein